MSKTDPLPPRAITLNLTETLEIARLGVRRASAFMAVGLQALGEQPIRSATRPSAMRFGFLPDPLPESMAEHVTEEYRAWLVGSGLRELDQYFGHFADRVWWTICAGELHGTEVQMDHVIGGKFHADTNVSRKIARIVDRIGEGGIKTSYFDAFSRARNSLGHGAGRVRERDATDDGTLVLRWLAPQAVVEKDGLELPFLGEQLSVELPNPGSESEAIISIKIVERTRHFALGDDIRLSPHDLSEICFFYHQQAASLVVRLREWLLERGLPEAMQGAAQID